MAWREAIFEGDQQNQLNRLMLMLFASDRYGNAHIIGSACIVLIQGRQALAVTANHNFDEARRIRQPYEQSHASTPSFFKPELPAVDLSPRHIRAMYFDGETADACEITAVNAIPGLDIAFFTVRFQEHYRGKDFELIAMLDSRPLEIGERVAILALHQFDLEQEFLGPESWNMRVARGLTLRSGLVIDVRFADGRMGWPLAETTIPIAGGMSGAPVFRLNDDDSLTRGICAIASRDLSDPAAFTSYEVPGHSTVALMYPAFLTPVRVGPPDWNSDKLPTILDLVGREFITDLGNFRSLFSLTIADGRITIQPRQIFANRWNYRPRRRSW